MREKLTGKKYKEGFATLEILIAFVILILCIGAVIMVIFGGQSVAVDSQNNSEAISKAQKLLEEARATSRFDFNLVNPSSQIEMSGPLAFTKELAVRQVDLFTKQATATVSWSSGGRLLSVFFTTLLTNLEAVYGGNTCNSILAGDWANPLLLGDIDVGENNGATDVDVFMDKAYVTADPSATPKEDFYVIDIQVAPPQLVKTFKITAVTGNGAYGKSIFYKNGYVYLGLYNTDSGPEFNIIDVSNPFNPIWKGGYPVSHEINAIYVRDGFAYIASPHNSELIILDISNPTNPVLAGEADLFNNSSNGKSMAIVGNA